LVIGGNSGVADVHGGRLLPGRRASLLVGSISHTFEREPEVHPGLLGLDSVVIVPHLGTATLETRVAMGMTAAANLLAALEGRRPPNLLNPEALG
jgi:lactate dehydrogenase-like 2-hydroxyacid dehydrogenase